MPLPLPPLPLPPSPAPTKKVTPKNNLNWEDAETHAARMKLRTLLRLRQRTLQRLQALQNSIPEDSAVELFDCNTVDEAPIPKRRSRYSRSPRSANASNSVCISAGANACRSQAQHVATSDTAQHTAPMKAGLGAPQVGARSEVQSFAQLQSTVSAANSTVHYTSTQYGEHSVDAVAHCTGPLLAKALAKSRGCMPEPRGEQHNTQHSSQHPVPTLLQGLQQPRMSKETQSVVPQWENRSLSQSAQRAHQIASKVLGKGSEHAAAQHALQLAVQEAARRAVLEAAARAAQRSENVSQEDEEDGASWSSLGSSESVHSAFSEESGENILKENVLPGSDDSDVNSDCDESAKPIKPQFGVPGAHPPSEVNACRALARSAVTSPL